MGRNNDRVPVPMKYKVKVIIFNDDGLLDNRSEKPFRLRIDAEDYAKKLKKEHFRAEVNSFMEVIKLEGQVIVNTFKNKNKKLRNKSKRR